MRLVEVIVNIPIRRSFSRQALEGPPPEPEFYGALADKVSEQNAQADTGYQSFHYHLPPELEGVIQLGHLVWVPFGARDVQGFVLSFANSSPVPTKAVRRLARQEPVLTPVQLELAQWLAQAYAAPLAEAIKLFLPPGLLTKSDGKPGVRAKRELQARWVGGDLPMDAALAKMARETAQTRLLAWLLEQDGTSSEVSAAVAALEQPRTKLTLALNGLVEKGLITRTGEQIQLIVEKEAAQQTLSLMRGVDKYEPILARLIAAGGPMWKSDLYGEVDADLTALRRLQSA